MILNILIITYLIACLNYKPFHHECYQDAIQRGWHPFIIHFTRVTQYFTLYGQLWVIIAMMTDIHQFKIVAQYMGLWVFGLYSAIVYYDPTLLAWDDPDLVRQVTGMVPPMNKYFVVWCGLFFQHRIIPLWYIVFEPVKPTFLEAMLAYVFASFFMTWSAFTWEVQGKPAYPIQEKLGEHYDMAKKGISWYMITTILILIV